MTPDDPGVWLFHCHVNDHLVAGLVSRYQVLRDRRRQRREGGISAAGTAAVSPLAVRAAGTPLNL
jgi:hypothetical protein